MSKFNYENKQYLDKLNDLKLGYYSKYIKFIRQYLPQKESTFLDVGCGNGTVLFALQKKGYKNGYGLDISRLFISEAKKRGLKNVFSYSGKEFPFEDSQFDLVGSFNVLEHSENPEQFLSEQLSKLKKDGILIVACPNFLSVLMNSPHPKIKGVFNRAKNFLSILIRLNSSRYKFQKMAPIIRKKFEYDDDAIVLTNLIDLEKFFKKKKCKIIYESGFINFDSLLFKIVNMFPILRYMLPSCFIVVRK